MEKGLHTKCEGAHRSKFACNSGVRDGLKKSEWGVGDSLNG